MMGSHNKQFATSLVMGAIFVILGLLEVVAPWIEGDWVSYLSGSGNIVFGLVLLVTAAVFLFAAKEYRAGKDGDAFLIVGCGLALFVGLVAFLTLAANATEAYLLGNEDFAEWSPLDDFTPVILMMIPSLAILWYQLRTFWSVGSKAAVMEGKA